MASKIQLYSLATPNGEKISIALEEAGLEYDAHTVNIWKNEQFSPEFVAVNPNSKIPAITDPNGPGGKPISVWESGAILQYIAEKSGKLLPKDEALKWEAIEWVYFQVAGIGPMLGQFGHFNRLPKEKMDHPYPVERYRTEVLRLFQVLETRLQGREYLVGEEYTIADIASFPWLWLYYSHPQLKDPLNIASLPNVVAWLERIAARPATKRGLGVCPF